MGAEVTCLVLERGHQSPWSFESENSAFSIAIETGRGVFRFKHPVPSLAAAENSVREFLASFEGDSLLRVGPISREFRVNGSSAPGHGGRTYAEATFEVSGPLAEATTREQQPWRRHVYWHIPLVRGLIERYEAYRKGHEKLTVMVFFCLSAVEHVFKGRRQLANHLAIDLSVLSQAGRLVSTVGSYSSARKLDKKHHEIRELTDAEVYWLEVVSRELIRRTGELLDGRKPGGRLFQSDLPPL